MASESHCDICGTEIVQGSCQNPKCENCSCFFGDDDGAGYDDKDDEETHPANKA